MTAKQRRLLKRARDLEVKIFDLREAYKELDEVTMQLIETGFKRGGGYHLIDQFDDVNTAFRAAAFSRFVIRRIIK